MLYLYSSTENMTFFLIQIRRNIDAKMDQSKWENKNPKHLKYEENPNKPFLYLHMQLGSCITPSFNKVHFENDFVDYQTKIENDEYLKKNQMLLVTRGINITNFPFLNKKEAQALEDLAFADQAFKKYLKLKNAENDRYIEFQYKSVMEFGNKQETSEQLEAAEKKIKDKISKFQNYKIS